MEATATPQTVKGGSKKDPKFTPEQRKENKTIWKLFLEGKVPEGISPEQITEILFCLSLRRYYPHVLQMMTQFGLPHPERGSLSLDFFETLRSTSTCLFNERVKELSLEEIKFFFEKLPFLGDEEQVSGDFPNQPGSKAKFHTLHSEDANNILSALLEQAKRLEAIITELMTLKLDGSCGTAMKVQLENQKLVFPGSKLLTKDEIQKRVSSLEKSIDKVSKSITDRMPESKKMEKQKELEQLKVQLAYFNKMLLDIAEIEATGVEGSTYEILILGNEMNDLTSAMYPILYKKTIFLHSDLAIPEMVLPPQDSASPQPASTFLQMDKARILQKLNELCKARCEAIINAERDSTGRQPFVFQSVPILKETAMSSVCEGGVLHITVSFPDGIVFRICLKVKNPEMNQEKRNHCIYSETFTEADYYALLKKWLIPGEVPAVEAVLDSAGGGQAGEP
jgi:hypothetical protein